MERLTDRSNRDGISIQRMFDCLSAYEDTGLTPEEVMDLQQAWDMYGGEDGITAALEELERRRMKSCEECINRVFCPVYGESCFRHNDEEAFWQFLAMIAPSVKWDKVREASRRLREEGERELEGAEGQAAHL